MLSNKMESHFARRHTSLTVGTFLSSGLYYFLLGNRHTVDGTEFSEHIFHHDKLLLKNVLHYIIPSNWP
jgi:hypothetical protein